jgi:hypothetical protein
MQQIKIQALVTLLLEIVNYAFQYRPNEMGVHLPCSREVSGSNIDPEISCAEVILFLTATQGRKIKNVYSTYLVSHCNESL